MAMNIERAEKMEEGEAIPTSPKETQQQQRSSSIFVLLLYCSITAVGTIGGPLLVRLYYVHGGNKKWLTSWLQTAGFPLLLPPLTFFYMRKRALGMPFFFEAKLFAASAVLGVIVGVDNFMYSLGSSYLPVSTSSLLFATQLAFTAFFALIIVRQKFTPYSINAVVLMTLGSVLLGIRKSGDRPPGVSSGEYMLGFIVTIGAAALLGFGLPCIELSYAKARRVDLSVVMQFQFNLLFFSTLVCTVGMIVNKDFQSIAKEAAAYELGETKYYLVLVGLALVFQAMFVGSLGVVFCASSLFAGILNSTFLPLTEIVGAIVFKEKFTGEKGMALALCLWGFSSYFYGSYRMNKKQAAEEEEKQIS